tara:strand:+ start:1009 stop:2196 length:1188 start_codon:yes stop_codon:yes gene_type:complete
MARKRKTKKKYKKGGADGDTSTNVSTDSAAESTEEEKRNQERYGANILAAEEVPAPVVEFSKGRYFNPKVEESIELSENQQPCLICHNTEGPLINKGKYQLNVRIRKCPNCNSLFHRRCLAEWFSRKVCDGSDPSCPVCRINWPFEEDSIFLLEEEQHRIIRETQQPQRTEQQLQNIEIPVPTNRRNPFARLCRFISRRTLDIGNGTFFGTRRIRNNVVVPQGGRRKRRKKTRRKRRRGGTKRKREEGDGPPTPRRAPRRRLLNPPQQQQPQPQGEYDINDADVREYEQVMGGIAHIDPDDPNFFQGGKRKKRRKKRRKRKRTKKICCVGPGCPEWKHCINVLGDKELGIRPKSKNTLKIMKKCGKLTSSQGKTYKKCMKLQRKRLRETKKNNKK